MQKCNCVDGAGWICFVLFISTAGMQLTSCSSTLMKIFYHIVARVDILGDLYAKKTYQNVKKLEILDANKLKFVTKCILSICLTDQPAQQPYRDRILNNFVLGVYLCLKEWETTKKPCDTICPTPNMHPSSSTNRRCVFQVHTTTNSSTGTTLNFSPLPSILPPPPFLKNPFTFFRLW